MQLNFHSINGRLAARARSAQPNLSSWGPHHFSCVEIVSEEREKDRTQDAGGYVFRVMSTVCNNSPSHETFERTERSSQFVIHQNPPPDRQGAFERLVRPIFGLLWSIICIRWLLWGGRDEMKDGKRRARVIAPIWKTEIKRLRRMVCVCLNAFVQPELWWWIPSSHPWSTLTIRFDQTFISHKRS